MTYIDKQQSLKSNTSIITIASQLRQILQIQTLPYLQYSAFYFITY